MRDKNRKGHQPTEQTLEFLHCEIESRAATGGQVSNDFRTSLELVRLQTRSSVTNEALSPVPSQN
jgi:hypothetical protein